MCTDQKDIIDVVLFSVVVIGNSKSITTNFEAVFVFMDGIEGYIEISYFFYEYLYTQPTRIHM